MWVQISFSSVSNDYLVNTFSMNLKEAGSIMVMYGLIGLAMSLLAGFLAGRMPLHTRLMVMACHMLMAVFCVAFGYLTSTTGAIIGICLVGMMVSFGNPLYSILIADNSSPEWMATAGGLSNTIFQLGALLSPLVVGKVITVTGDYGAAWWVLGAGALGGAVCAYLLKSPSAE